MNPVKPIRWLAVLLALCALLSGCAKKAAPAEAADDHLSIYASFYPIYALASLLTDDVSGVQLHCLVQPQDGCLRSYSLSDWDLALLANSADAVILGGRGLESFESLLYMLGDHGPAIAPVLHELDLAHQRAENTSADSDSHWMQDNPHIYMDVDGALEITRRITASLSVLDKPHEEAYAENLRRAQQQLNELKAEIEAQLAPLQGEKVIVMNEALVYADSAYGLQIDLCYERESGENIEGADLNACLETLRRSDASVILLEKQAPQQLCSALEGAGYCVARMDILSTRRAVEGSGGYFEAQRANVQAIIDAFTEKIEENA